MLCVRHSITVNLAECHEDNSVVTSVNTFVKKWFLIPTPRQKCIMHILAIINFPVTLNAVHVQSMT